MTRAVPATVSQKAASGAHVLVIEDSALLAMSYAAHLTRAGHMVEVCGSGAEAACCINGPQQFDVVLLDLQLPDIGGLELLRNHAARLAQARVIVLTGNGSLSCVVDAMRAGAHDFMVKPVNPDRLLTAIAAAHNRASKARKTPISDPLGAGTLPADGASAAPKPKGEFHGFIGSSPIMHAVYEAIENIANSKATVFITGESGTGKEVAAEAIHHSGQRATRPFVAINCGAIPENLLESELFGHVKGAFTGAVEHRIGAAKQADGGTLFLDEICEMELKLQVKLLRFLQTGMIQRVGASETEALNIRVLCATNRIAEIEVAEGRFREDLYYRLNVIPLIMPPLRERGDDIVEIARCFAHRFGQEEGRTISGLTQRSTERLRAYSWPGNVRELQNTIRRAVIMGSGPELEVAISTEMSGQKDITSQQPRQQAHGPSPRFQAMTMEAIEQSVISERIANMSGNVTRAAQSLKLSPSTIYRKLDKWSMTEPHHTRDYPA